MNLIANYSWLNCYDYSHKNKGLICLDIGSSPLRCLLGGRNISLFSNKVDPATTEIKVIAVFFFIISFIISPILPFISIACLAVKILAFSKLKEKKAMTAHIDNLAKDIKKFNSVTMNNHDQALKIIEINPKLLELESIYTSFYHSIKKEMIDSCTLHQTQESIKHLHFEHRNELVCHDIKRKLINEFNSKIVTITGDEIARYLGYTLDYKLSDIKKCYENIISSCLKIQANEDIYISIIKINIVDQMINGFKKIVNQSWFDFDGIARMDLNQMRLKILPSAQLNLQLYSLIQDEKKLEPIIFVINDIQDIECYTLQCINQVNALISQEKTNKIDHWDEIRTQFIIFKNSLRCHPVTANKNENKWMNTFETSLNVSISWIDKKLYQEAFNDEDIMSESPTLFNSEHTDPIFSKMILKREAILLARLQEIQSLLYYYANLKILQ